MNKIGIRSALSITLSFIICLSLGTITTVTAGKGPISQLAHGVPDEPSINGPRIVGTTPGRPFLFLIPATGDGPLEYKAEGLPEGLVLDSETGIIRGSVKSPGAYTVALTVTGPKGRAKRNLVIVGGEHKLALTPPMGWNSWNVWGASVSDDKVRDAADAMVSSGLAAHGYQYVNIDDAWEGDRNTAGIIRTNGKFPNMKDLADYVHAKGLKIGIYSSPGPMTCQEYEGSYGFECQDAATYAEWGIDYLKYDWCYYRKVVEGRDVKYHKKPYQIMRDCLDNVDRDIVYSICQYGMKDVETWGAEVGGNLWRTTMDIRDFWLSMSLIGFRQNGLEKYSGPGHWNDPDMLVVGKVGWGSDLHPSRLTPDEQVTHITLWSMLAAPMLIGCDMSDMEDFTLALLTNDEVLDVNQDPLGVQGSRKIKKGRAEVWSRPLWDGTTAVALFNRYPWKKKITVPWSALGMIGAQPVRDLWLREDLGEFEDGFTAEVNGHGAVFIKVGKPKRRDFDHRPVE